VGGEQEVFIDSPFNNQTNDADNQPPALAVVEAPQASNLESSGIVFQNDTQQQSDQLPAYEPELDSFEKSQN
jgi:hypothetical protein